MDKATFYRTVKLFWVATVLVCFAFVFLLTREAKADSFKPYITNGVAFLRSIGYPPPRHIPPIVVTPTGTMPCRDCAAAYRPEIMYVDSRLVAKPYEFQGAVIHELVHHYQHERGEYGARNCRELVIQEMEAERARVLYLDSHGVSTNISVPKCNVTDLIRQ